MYLIIKTIVPENILYICTTSVYFLDSFETIHTRVKIYFNQKR